MAQLSDRAAQSSDRFEMLINSGSMPWRVVKFNELPKGWIRMVAEEFLGPHQFTWYLGDIGVGEAVCIKIEDPFLQYLDIFPDNTFMWCTNDHHDSVHPDEALAYLLRRMGAHVQYRNLNSGAQIWEFGPPKT